MEPESMFALLTVPPPVKLLMRAIALASSSANHMFLSGPAVMPFAFVLSVGIGYSEMPPVGVQRPMALKVPGSVNHRLPSGPPAIAYGRPPEGRPNSVMTPAGVTRPELCASVSTNHTLPSGPAAMAFRKSAGGGTGTYATGPAGATAPR